MRTASPLMRLLRFPSLCLLILRDYSRGACANTLRRRWLAFQNKSVVFAFLLFHLTDACFPPSISTTSSSPEPSPRQRGPPLAFFPHPAVVALVCMFLHQPLIGRPETQPPLHPPDLLLHHALSVASAASCLRCDSVPSLLGCGLQRVSKSLHPQISIENVLTHFLVAVHHCWVASCDNASCFELWHLHQEKSFVADFFIFHLWLNSVSHCSLDANVFSSS